MEQLIRMKFTRYADLREKLLATGDAQLVEGNTWNNRFWGVCRGQGPQESQDSYESISISART